MTAVFETMRVRNGRIPLLELHLERFAANAAAATGRELPADVGLRIGEAGHRRADDHVVRAEWDGHDLSMTTRDLPSLQSVSLIISAIPHPGYTVKTVEREAFDRARIEAHDAGADEAILLTPQGYLAEGSIFALAWFAGDKLRLPSLDLGILPSIGRARVISEASELGLKTEEGRFEADELAGKPALVTTSVRGVVPIRSIDGRNVPPDERIQALADVFWP